jgi:protein SCO1/2
MGRRLAIAAAAGAVIAFSGGAAAHGVQPDGKPGNTTLNVDRSLELSQQAIGRVTGNYRFVDSKGGSISLSELRGKPLVVSLIYTSCAHICPMTTQRLRRAVEDAQRVMGSDRFGVISIGFDSRNDTPMRMAAFARAQGVDLPNWRFLSADDATASALAKELGFSYTAYSGGFVHTTQTTILDRDGRVYRQVYGDDFPIQVFMEPLKEAVYGTVGTFLNVEGLLDRVRFLCTVYDPTQGRYRISYAIAMSLLAGIISLGTTALIISRAWLHSRRAS